MKRSLTPSYVFSALLILVASMAFGQTSRFMKPSPRDFSSGYSSPRSSSPSYNRSTIDYEAIQRRRMQEAVECYNNHIKYFIQAAENDQARVDYHEPDSEWIEHLIYIAPHRTTFDLVIMRSRSGDVYAFRMDPSTWERWKSSSSAGWFYNNYIKGESKYSLESACGL